MGFAIALRFQNGETSKALGYNSFGLTWAWYTDSKKRLKQETILEVESFNYSNHRVYIHCTKRKKKKSKSKVKQMQTEQNIRKSSLCCSQSKPWSSCCRYPNLSARRVYFPKLPGGSVSITHTSVQTREASEQLGFHHRWAPRYAVPPRAAPRGCRLAGRTHTSPL